MNKALRTVLLIVLLSAFISTISYCSAPYDTETAHTINIRKTISGEGLILRNETRVAQAIHGVFEPGVKDGVRVARGSAVGVAISGNLSQSLIQELEAVTKRIAEIKESDNFADIYDSDEARIFSALKNLSQAIRSDVLREDFASAAGNTLQLSTLLEKKYSAENKGAAAELLVSLEEEKYNLEQQLGGIREEVKAPASGYFYKALDGLETAANEKELLKLTPVKLGDMEKELNSYTPSGEYVGKIIDTYCWYLAAVIPASEAQYIKAGDTVSLSVDEGSSVKAAVMTVNVDESDRAAIVIKCNRDVSGIYEKRAVEFEICYEEYSGLYVPAAAIRVVDDVTGVYVINENESVTFRCVDIILHEEDYYIVRSKYTPPASSPYEALRVYDNILVNPEVAI